MNKQHRQAYQAIKEVCQDHYGWIKILLEYVGVSRQAYFKFHNHQENEFEVREKILKKYVKAVYEEHGKSIGAGKILSNLRNKKILDFDVTIKQIKRIMRDLGIMCIVRKKKKDHKKLESEYLQDNLLKQRFTASRPNEIWLSDSTQLEYGKKDKHKVRLSGILDLCGNYLVGYKISKTETAEAEVTMFEETFEKIGDVHPLVHTDRGSAYVSESFNVLLRQHKVTRSMSRPGTPYDNAPIEHWWGEFKSRWMDLHPVPATLEDLIDLVVEGINYFNNMDRSATRKDLTPAEYWNEAFV